MTFRDYLRWDGGVLIVAGAGLCVFGLIERHQGIGDAVFSGVMMILGTAVFMAVRHHAPLRHPSAWFTDKPVARASKVLPGASRLRLLISLLAETATLAAFAVGLSFVTGFWLTYMDVGVWAIFIGSIKIGPAAATVAKHETEGGATYHVARRPLRGLVQLVAHPTPKRPEAEPLARR